MPVDLVVHSLAGVAFMWVQALAAVAAAETGLDGRAGGASASSDADTRALRTAEPQAEAAAGRGRECVLVCVCVRACVRLFVALACTSADSSTTPTTLFFHPTLCAMPTTTINNNQINTNANADAAIRGEKIRNALLRFVAILGVVIAVLFFWVSRALFFPGLTSDP